MAVSESRAEALLSTGLALAAELSLPVLLQRLIELAVELTEARYGALGVLSADGTHLVDFVTTGITDAERAAIGDLPHGRGILGVLIDEAHPLRLDDIAADARSVGFPPNHPHMRSFLGAPVRAHGRVFGNIYLTDKRTAPAFTAEDEAALVVLATQAGVAVANARLYDEVQRAQAEVARLKVLEDRERIARDLHDGIIQSLFAIGLGLQGTSAVIGDARLADRIQQAVAEIDRVIGDLRSYIFGLRPSVLAAGDLTNALEQLAHEFQERSGVTTVVDVDASLEGPLAGMATHVTQLVREALANVSRHAHAETCRVSVRQESGGVLIEVDDDGRGFDLDTAPRGLGLVNMGERATTLGGFLEIESHPGQGTAIRVTLPR